MNMLVIGLGSMGKRRIRLLRELYPDFKIFGVDGRPDRRQEAKEQSGVECADSVEAASRTFPVNAAFVCTSPPVSQFYHYGMSSE